MDFQCAAHHVAQEAQLWTILRATPRSAAAKAPFPPSSDGNRPTAGCRPSPRNEQGRRTMSDGLLGPALRRGRVSAGLRRRGPGGGVGGRAGVVAEWRVGLTCTYRLTRVIGLYPS